MMIGNDYDYDGYIDGYIDDFRVYNRVLQNYEINMAYNNLSYSFNNSNTTNNSYDAAPQLIFQSGYIDTFNNSFGSDYQFDFRMLASNNNFTFESLSISGGNPFFSSSSSKLE